MLAGNTNQNFKWNRPQNCIQLIANQPTPPNHDPPEVHKGLISSRPNIKGKPYGFFGPVFIRPYAISGEGVGYLEDHPS